MAIQTLGLVDTGSKQDFEILQPKTTYTGAAIRPVPKGLPKNTRSLCPECSRIIDAVLSEENGKVVMEKSCPEHGFFKDTVYSDVRLYLKMEGWTFGDNRGVENPAVPEATECPTDCGLCSMHTSHTGLANLDLTNRCNLTCPVCFANANVQGYLYEPGIGQVRAMLQALRDERPVPCRIVQFSGGEPTIAPTWFDALRAAVELGFSHVQCASNGIRFADLEFAEKSKEAGLHTIYLQFDGVTDDIYLRTRGKALMETKVKAIENIRKAGMKICFVPTIVKGFNDHQVGDILKFAIDNIDVVSAISYQPVAFTGRINRRELEEKRYTMSDVALDIHRQTGIADPYHDWFPLACVHPFSKLLSALRGEMTTHLTPHPHCSLGTYLFVDQNKRATPVTQFIDVGAFLRDMDLEARRAQRAPVKLFSKINVWQSFRKHFHESRAPEGLTFAKFLQTLQGLVDKKYGRGENEKDGFTFKTLMLAGMHFMDHYNYDVERVKRCVIHYSAPDGRIYPFCAYNGGPTFREKIEKRYSAPFTPARANGCGGSGCGGL